MKKFINVLKEIGLWIWQILQNIGGLIVIAIMGYEKVLTAENGNKVYFSKKMSGGISLGKYSIISYYYICKCKTDDEILALDVTKHEALGHGKQSRWLGPFYLFVIGIPSIVWAGLYGAVIPYTRNGYYRSYTEKWADKLAGIVRS